MHQDFVVDSARPHSPINDSDAHRLMWRLKIAALALLITAVFSSLGLLVISHPAAYLAALPIPLFVLAYVIISNKEQEARMSFRPRSAEQNPNQEEIELDVEDAKVFTAFGIAFIIAIGTFIIAAIFFEWRMVAIAAIATLFLALLINIPYLTLLVQEAGEEEREKFTKQGR